MTWHRLPGFLVAALAVAACSTSDSVESTEPDPAPSTTESTTTVPETTTTVAETTTTEATTTTVAETTTTAATTTAPTTTAPPVDFGPAPTPPERAFAVRDTDLVEIDVASGSVTRTVVEFFNADGVFRGNLRPTSDGTSLWFSEGYEDGWFGCESSIGSVGRVDLATGALEAVAAGNLPVPSADGALVAFRTSEQCVPDPENPEMWVLTPYDQVVVRDLATGDEQRFATDPAPQAYGDPSEVAWLGFGPDGRLLVSTFDGDVRAVDLDGPATLQEHPVVGTVPRGMLVGVTDAGWVVSEVGAEGSTDLFLVDPESGAYGLMATSEGFMAAGVAANGAVVVAGFTDVAVEPGAPVTVLAVPDGATVYDVGW
ncbi:MAG: hypothetical protein ACLGHQ_08470 [Acidimicrobiia bacterium]